MKSMILALTLVVSQFAFADAVAVFQADYATGNGGSGQKLVRVNLLDQQDGTTLLLADWAQSADEARPVLAGYAMAQYAFSANLGTADYLCKSAGYHGAVNLSASQNPLPLLARAKLLTFGDNAQSLVVTSDRSEGYLTSATCQ